MNQSEAAIDLRFCLMARIVSVHVTNPRGVASCCGRATGPGPRPSTASATAAMLEQCRVYCAKTTTEAFAVLNSGGVRMTDCVSEGAACAYDLFLSATIDGDESRPASNTVVKSFTLANFHVEHSATKASIYVNMPSKAAVTLSNVYWNNKQTAPVILYVMGQLNLEDIGWFRQGVPDPHPHQCTAHQRAALPQFPGVREGGERTDKRAGCCTCRSIAEQHATEIELRAAEGSIDVKRIPAVGEGYLAMRATPETILRQLLEHLFSDSITIPRSRMRSWSYARSFLLTGLCWLLVVGAARTGFVPVHQRPHSAVRYQCVHRQRGAASGSWSLAAAGWVVPESIEINITSDHPETLASC